MSGGVNAAASPSTQGLNWLFVATFANGGSTAFAKLLASGSRVELLHETGEGQWLSPQLTDGGQAYGDIAIDYAMLRRSWTEELAGRRRPCIVVEKSPPNLIRMRELLRAFAPMPTTLVRLTRDPLAVCSSWDKRYSPAHLATEWGAPTGGMEQGSAEWFEALGRLYAERASAMAALHDVATATLRYEDLAADPAAALAGLAERIPLLDDVDPAAQIQVKDYPPAPLTDKNAQAIARLTEQQCDAIRRGLRGAEDALGALGYASTIHGVPA